LIRHLPNLLTLLRIFAVPIAVDLIHEERYGPAFLVFAAAGITDGIDGFLARVLKARTQIGAYLDPLADKALLVAVYIMLGYHAQLPVWLVILVVFRDLLIISGALVLRLVTDLFYVKPLLISKVNTVMQITLAGTVMAKLGFSLDLPEFLIFALIAAVAATTMASGMTYVVYWGRRVSRTEPS
jgi:cardiolipin synthase